MRKLKEEIFINFLQKGEYKEHILSQDLLEITGNHQRSSCVGGIGGMIG
jgi:hypothetical protein